MERDDKHIDKWAAEAVSTLLKLCRARAADVLGWLIDDTWL